MKFTTPASASEPYTADAPPVTTSTRLIRFAGMAFRSVRPVLVAGTKRRPLISTRVRSGARPRRSTVAVPSPPLLTCAPSPGTICGSSFRTSSTLTVPFCLKNSSLTTEIGLGLSRSARRMRDPVTTTSSTGAALADSAAAAVNAVVDRKIAPQAQTKCRQIVCLFMIPFSHDVFALRCANHNRGDACSVMTGAQIAQRIRDECQSRGTNSASR